MILGFFPSRGAPHEAAFPQCFPTISRFLVWAPICCKLALGPQLHLGSRLELKERELGGREKNGAKSRFLIKAQMFNGKCAYKGAGEAHSCQFILGAWNQLQVMMCTIGSSLQISSGTSQQVAVS